MTDWDEYVVDSCPTNQGLPCAIAGVAVEEQLADVVFEVLHRARDRLRRHAQPGGGFLEVARLGGGAEDAQHFEAVENRVLLTRRKGDGRLFQLLEA